MGEMVLIIGILFAFCIVSVLIILLISGRRKQVRGTDIIMLLFFVNMIYAFGYALELTVASAESKAVWNHFQYFGIPFIAPLWYMLSVQFKDRRYKWSLKKVLPVFILPVVTLAMNLTHGENGLLYSSLWMTEWKGVQILVFRKGYWYYANTVYQMALIMLAIINYHVALKKNRGVERKQALAMLALSASGLAVTFSGVFSAETACIDYASIFVSSSSILFLVALFKYELFELLPVAYLNVFEYAADPILILNDSLRLVKANRVARSFFSDILKDGAYAFLDELFDFFPDLTDTLRQKKEYLLTRTEGGKTVHFTARLISLVPPNGRSKRDIGYLLSFSNVTDHIHQVQKLEIAASVDPLTGLFNRGYFFKIAQRAIDKAKNEGQPLAVVMIDVDNFKAINDTYGHQGGDRVLKAVADIAGSRLRAGDTFARYGGEEFIIILPDTGPGAAKAIVQRVAAAVREAEVSHEGQAIKLTVSAGIGSAEPPAALSIDEYVALADSALYQAKKGGRDKVCLEKPAQAE